MELFTDKHLFDSEETQPNLNEQIAIFLEARLQEMKSQQNEARDLIVYYIGHGGFSLEGAEYFLAIKDTRAQDEYFSSYPIKALANILREHARFVRRYLILDSCFSAKAYEAFQAAGPLQVACQKALLEFPGRGTALLCATGPRDPAKILPSQEHTMFSEALLSVLRRGAKELSEKFSLAELAEITRLEIKERYPSDAVRPEVHSPDMREGDVAILPLFPNPALWPSVSPSELPKEIIEEDPYRGMGFFDVRHAPFFFGRKELTGKLLHKLFPSRDSGGYNRFLAITGPLGSGKSSLARAGLLSALKTGKIIKGSEAWPQVICHPDEDPLWNLVVALSQIPGVAQTPSELINLKTNLLKNEETLHACTCVALKSFSPESRLVLLVDQFEEVFALCSQEKDRQAFIDNLLYAAAKAGGQTVVVITLRTDFYDQSVSYPALREVLNNNQELIGSKIEALQEAIEEPARLKDCEVEPGLTEILLKDFQGQAGELPLLEDTLLELWKKRFGHRLTIAAYKDIGGVAGALQRRAEGIYERFSEQEGEICRRIFSRLTQIAKPGEGYKDTKRRANLRDLISSEEDWKLAETVVEKLKDARLVSAAEEEIVTKEYVEISHEALLQHWKRLRDWVDEDREFLLWRQKLKSDLADWQKGTGSLLAVTSLSIAKKNLDKRPQDLNEDEKSFIEKSIKLEESELAGKRRWKNLLTSVLVALAISGVIAIYQSRRAVQAKKVAQANLCVAQANNLLTRQARLLSTSILLSLKSLELKSSCEGIQALSAGLALLPKWPVELPQGMGDKGEPRGVLNVAFSPDKNNWVATIGENSPEVMIWKKGENSDKWIHRKTVAHEKLKVWDLAFSQDGRYLATVGYDNHVRVWNRDKDWKMTSPSREHEASIFAVAFYKNELLATGSIDGTVKVWNLPDCEPISQKRVEKSEIWKIAFHPKGQLLATAHTNGEAHLWRMAGKDLVPFGEPLKHDQEVGAVAFSPDGHWFATACNDCAARVWRLEDDSITIPSKPVKEMWHNGKMGRIAFSPNSDWLLTASEDGTARVWETKNWNEMTRLVHEPGIREKKAPAIAIDPYGKIVATGAWDGTARIWDPFTGKELKRMEHGKDVSAVVFSPDGKLLLTGSWDGKSRLWEVDDCVSASVAPERGLKALVLSSDNLRIATGGIEQIVRVWDAISGRLYKLMANEPAKEVPVPPVPKDQEPLLKDEHCRKPVMISLAFDKGGSRVASGGEDGKSRVWDVQSGSQVGETLNHGAYVWSVALSSDGKLLATGAGDTIVRLWELDNGSWMYRGSRKHVGRVNFLAFSVNGELLASGDMKGQVKMQSVKKENEKEFKSFQDRPAHDKFITSLAFSRDHEGRMLATGSKDRKIKIWDSQNGSLIAEKELDNEIIGSVFNHNGEYIATANKDGTVRVFKIYLQHKKLEEESRIATDDMVLAMAFTHEDNGKHLLITGKDHILRKRLWQKKDLMDKAHQLLPDNRKLEPDEEKLYGLSD